jgi:hypothetical protein
MKKLNHLNLISGSKIFFLPAMEPLKGVDVVEADRLYRWHPGARFIPGPNDLLFAPKTGLYELQQRIALIMKWRATAEEEALNAILIMTVGDLR